MSFSLTSKKEKPWKLCHISELSYIRQWPLGYLGRGHKLSGQHVDASPHCSIWLCYTASSRSSFDPQKKLNQVHACIKTFSDNENINLKMPSFLWQGNLLNRASKRKCLLARRDIHMPRASVKLKLHLCVSLSEVQLDLIKHLHYNLTAK